MWKLRSVDVREMTTCGGNGWISAKEPKLISSGSMREPEGLTCTSTFRLFMNTLLKSFLLLERRQARSFPCSYTTGMLSGEGMRWVVVFREDTLAF
jgi:hypothetical protein